MAARVKRVRLLLSEPGGVDRMAWPVTQGVPFADGDLACGTPVRVVDEAGSELPSQVQCLTTWGPDLKYVKWLLVDFQVDLRAGAAQPVWLEYGPGVQCVVVDRRVRVASRGGQLLIDTGPLQAVLRYGHADFFAACRLRCGAGWRDVLRGGPGPHLYMADQNGVRYDSCTAAPAPEICIEEEGLLRTAIRVAGFHASSDGRRFCPYILRLHFYAGRPEIRWAHTFLFDQDAEDIELGEIGVYFPLTLGGDLGLAFGGSEATHSMGQCDQGQLVQVSDQAYQVTGDGTLWARGTQTRGWASLCGSEASAAVVLRDLWQEYPKGLALDGGGIDVQIWPATCGAPLGFSTPFKEEAVRFSATRDEAEFRRLVTENPTAPLNLKSLAATTVEDLQWVEEMVARYAPGRPASYNDTGVHNGQGAAKTTEFLLRFSAESIPDREMEDLGIGIQHPVLAPADPVYACATEAMRLVAAKEPGRSAAAEEGLEGLFERIVLEPRTRLRTYGMVDYGDLMCSHSGSPAVMWQWAKDDGDVIEKMKHCARSYNNEANDQLHALWMFFARTGERQYFLAAEAYGRHMADVDIIHTSSHNGQAGLVHYHNCHHWTGGPSPSHTCIAGLMLQYYLTGNRRIFEICREVADWALGQQEPCGIFSNRQGALVREFTTPVANLLEFYQATWEQRYLALAQPSLKWLLLAMPEPGCFPLSVYTAGVRGDEAEVEQAGWHLRQAGGMTPQLLYDAVLLMGHEDPSYRQALVAMARRYVLHRNDIFEVIRIGPEGVEQLDPYFNAPIVAYAYLWTEEPIFAAYCRYYLRHHFSAEADKMSFTYVCWGSIIPPLMEAVRRAETALGIAALDQAEAEWIERVRARGDEDSTTVGDRPRRRWVGAIEGYNR